MGGGLGLDTQAKVQLLLDVAQQHQSWKNGRSHVHDGVMHAQGAQRNAFSTPRSGCKQHAMLSIVRDEATAGAGLPQHEQAAEAHHIGPIVGCFREAAHAAEALGSI